MQNHDLLKDQTIIIILFHYRVISTVYFTAISIGQVSSIAPDLTKAKISASRILSLLKRKPQIDASRDEGIKLV